MTLSLCVSFLLAKAFSASCTVLRKVELICERTSSDADAKALFLFLLFLPRLTGVLDFSLPVLFARETGAPLADVFVDPERVVFFREEIFREDAVRHTVAMVSREIETGPYTRRQLTDAGFSFWPSQVAALLQQADSEAMQKTAEAARRVMEMNTAQEHHVEPYPGATVPEAAKAAEKPPRFCPNCGAPADGGAFCAYCGSPLKAK